MKFTAVAMLFLCWSALSYAKPPPGADPDSEIAHWYQSLEQPQTGMSCCSAADCRNVDYKTVGDHYEVYIDKKTFGEDAPDAWVRVPDKNIIRRENPTGSAVACWYVNQVLCFVESSQG